MFVDQTSEKPATVVIKRDGQQMTITMNTKAFVEEHLASDNKLQDFGLIVDESDPEPGEGAGRHSAIAGFLCRHAERRPDHQLQRPANRGV